MECRRFLIVCFSVFYVYYNFFFFFFQAEDGIRDGTVTGVQTCALPIWAGGYSSTGTTNLEALFAGTWTTVGANYTVAAGIMFVFCTSGVTITLPDPTITNRPITIAARIGSSTVGSASGSVNGGSVNTTTGAIMNGVVSQGDSITWKSDGSNWYVV